MKKRVEKLRSEMLRCGLDALWVSGGVNHRYFSGFDNPDGALLICHDNAYAFEDFRYIEAAKREIDGSVFEVIMPESKRAQWLPVILSANLVKRVGYEDSLITCRTLENLKSDCPQAEFIPIYDLVDKMRRFKDAEEVEFIMRAQRIAESAFDELLRNIDLKATESEVAAELEYIMKKKGAHGISFETIAVSGKNSSSPHGVPGNVPLEKGFLTFDFGATYNGYHSDMTRTVCVGRADDEMKRLYNTVLRAQMAVLEVISEGQSNFKMDKIARDIIDNAGYKGCFGHSLGHGVGLDVHEKPVMAPSSGDAKLIAGEIVTVEPGIYVAGKYGCRIEDMVHIVPGGAVNLTDCPKELIELL